MSMYKKDNEKCYMPNSNTFILSLQYLWGFDTLGKLSATTFKEDNFCDFLFAFLYSKSLLNRTLC